MDIEQKLVELVVLVTQTNELLAILVNLFHVFLCVFVFAFGYNQMRKR